MDARSMVRFAPRSGLRRRSASIAWGSNIAAMDRQILRREVLERIELARRKRPRLKDERITLAHGAGGKANAYVGRRAVPRGISQPDSRRDGRSGGIQCERGAACVHG